MIRTWRKTNKVGKFETEMKEIVEANFQSTLAIRERKMSIKTLTLNIEESCESVEATILRILEFDKS